MATLQSEVVQEELIGHEAVEQMSKHAALKSVDVTESLLMKRKPSSAHNAPKPPAEKRKKSSALPVQFVRSPLMNRVLVSPRIRHSRAKHLRSPSMIRDGPSSMEQELHQPTDVPPGFHFQPTNEEQICGSQDGGQLHPALLPLQQIESQLPV